jgi:hypothetical protein
MGIGHQIDVLEPRLDQPGRHAPTVYTSGISHSGMDHAISHLRTRDIAFWRSRLPRLIRVIGTVKAEPPSGRAAEGNGTGVLRDYRAGGRALRRAMTWV